MERDFQQLLIIVAVVAFSLLDLFLRWLKKKADGGAPPRPMPPMDDEDAYEAYEVKLPWPLPDAPPARVPEPVRSVPVPASAPTRQKALLPERSGDSTAPRRSVGDAGRVAPAAAVVGRRLKPARFSERDARRAIVLAAVFGPPRGVDEYR
jgi:hypothetical protein